MKKKIAVVTGGAAGIGFATCQLLAENDYLVILSDINESLGKTAANNIQEKGGEAIFHKLDVSKFEEVISLIGKVVEQYERIDLLVNNAGIGPKRVQKTADHDLDEWDKIVAINQSGVFYGMKAAVGQMMKQGFGNIVNVASLAGLKASGTGIAYSASKFAVVGMTKSAAWEYASKNIRINCVCPAFTETALLNDSELGHPEMKAKLLKAVPMRRFADPIEIAKSILWLASDQSSYVTGHALTVDGGMMM